MIKSRWRHGEEEPIANIEHEKGAEWRKRTKMQKLPDSWVLQGIPREKICMINLRGFQIVSKKREEG